MIHASICFLGVPFFVTKRMANLRTNKKSEENFAQTQAVPQSKPLTYWRLCWAPKPSIWQPLMTITLTSTFGRHLFYEIAFWCMKDNWEVKRWKVLRRMKIFFLRRKRRAEETNEKILWEKEILIHREQRKMQKEKTFFLLQNLYYAHSDINNKKLISSEHISMSYAPPLSDDWYI